MKIDQIIRLAVNAHLQDKGNPEEVLQALGGIGKELGENVGLTLWMHGTPKMELGVRDRGEEAEEVYTHLTAFVEGLVKSGIRPETVCGCMLVHEAGWAVSQGISLEAWNKMCESSFKSAMVRKEKMNGGSQPAVDVPVVIEHGEG